MLTTAYFLPLKIRKEADKIKKSQLYPLPLYIKFSALKAVKKQLLLKEDSTLSHR